MTHNAYPVELRHLHQANDLGGLFPGPIKEDGPPSKHLRSISSMESVDFQSLGEHSIVSGPITHRFLNVLFSDVQAISALEKCYTGQGLDASSWTSLCRSVDSFLAAPPSFVTPTVVQDHTNLSAMREKLFSLLSRSQPLTISPTTSPSSSPMPSPRGESATPFLPSSVMIMAAGSSTSSSNTVTAAVAMNTAPPPPTPSGETQHRTGAPRAELVDHLVGLHNLIHPDSLRPANCPWVAHLVTALLHSLLLPLPSLPENTLEIPHRARVISVLVKNVLCPTVSPGVRDDIYFSSVAMLGLLLPNELRVPRHTLDRVIRPVLKPVCHVDQVTDVEKCPSLMAFLGLCHTVDLIPQLFNRFFASKIVSIVRLCTTPDHVLFHHPDRHQILPLLVRFFCSMARCVDCTQDIPHLCTAVGVYIRSLSHDLPSPQREQVRESVALALFHFLGCYPQAAADTLLQTSNRDLMAHLSQLSVFQESSVAAELRGRYLSAGQGAPSAFSAKEFLLSSELSDITLVVGPGGSRIPAHKMVLMRSAYFGPLFTNGMMESGESIVYIPEDEQVFQYILHHMYDSPLPLPNNHPALLAVHSAASYYCLPQLQTDCQLALTALITPGNALEVAQTLGDGRASDSWSVLDQKCRDALFSEPRRLPALDMHDPVVRRLICKPLSLSL